MKDTVIDKENAVLFQRVSSLKQFDEVKVLGESSSSLCLDR